MKWGHAIPASIALSLLGCAAPEQPTPAEEAQSAATNLPVKKSRRGICHVSGTSDYEATTSFEPFPTLDACLQSGGRLPAPKGRKDPQASLIRMSQNKVCHSPASPNYSSLKDYTTYPSMQACKDDGGREYK